MLLIRCFFIFLTSTFLLTACVSPSYNSSIADLPAFTSNDRSITADEVIKDFVTASPLLVTAEMREFTESIRKQNLPIKSRALALHKKLSNSDNYQFFYDSDSTLTAKDAFISRQGNCLGFTNLYIALARELGINAQYQLVTSHPGWQREGKRISMSIHVNVVVHLPRQSKITIDINPDAGTRIEEAEVISDEFAEAFFYNNLGMQAFFDGNNEKAFELLTKAIYTSPNIDMLWSNVGAIYRDNGQIKEAEELYKVGIAIDSSSYTAMNNLAALYLKQERYRKFSYYFNKIKYHQRKNPYHHYMLGQEALAENKIEEAIRHFRKAAWLKPKEGDFHYQISKLYLELDDRKNSLKHIKMAIKTPATKEQRQTYQSLLEQVTNQQNS